MKKRTNFRKLLIIALAFTVLLVPIAVNANGPEEGHGHGARNWHLYGQLTDMPADGLIGEWSIDGETFITDGDTVFEQNNGDFVIGAYVHAVGQYDENGQRVASQVATIFEDRTCEEDGADCWRLYGTVEAMPADKIGEWNIGGETVIATTDTNFREHFGELAVDAYVVSTGYFDDAGQRVAVMIGTMPVMDEGDHQGSGWYVNGTITALPADLIGTWTVGEQSFYVNEETHLNDMHGPFEVGATVKASGTVDEDGNAVAHMVRTVDTSHEGDNGGNGHHDGQGGQGDQGGQCGQGDQDNGDQGSQGGQGGQGGQSGDQGGQSGGQGGQSSGGQGGHGGHGGRGGHGR